MNACYFYIQAGSEHDVYPTCSERGEDEPVVERLCGSIVVLQQHPVRFLRFAGVKYRLQLQELQRRTNTNNPQAQSSETECKTEQAKKEKKTIKLNPNWQPKQSHLQRRNVMWFTLLF